MPYLSALEALYKSTFTFTFTFKLDLQASFLTKNTTIAPRVKGQGQLSPKFNVARSFNSFSFKHNRVGGNSIDNSKSHQISYPPPPLLANGLAYRRSPFLHWPVREPALGSVHNSAESRRLCSRRPCCPDRPRSRTSQTRPALLFHNKIIYTFVQSAFTCYLIPTTKNSTAI